MKPEIVYTVKEHCPYCGAGKEDFIVLPPRRESLIDGPTEDNAIVTLIPAFCKKCQVAFNYQTVKQEIINEILSQGKYITTSSTNSNSGIAYEPFINKIEEYCKKDDPIVEFGCYDGFVIKELLKRGYTKLLGFEPGPYFDKNLPIKQDFFTQDGLEKGAYKAIVCRNSVSILPDLHALMKACNYGLRDDGLIIFQFLSVLAVHVLQEYMFTVSFIDKLMQDHGFNIIKLDAPLRPYHNNQYFTVIAQKSDVLLKKPLNRPLKPYFSDKERLEIFNESQEALRAPTFSESVSERLHDFFAKHQQDEIVIYGTGGASFSLLKEVGDLSSYKLKFVDGDKRRDGHVYIAPDGSKHQVTHSSCLKDTQVKALMFAVFDLNFKTEIEAYLKELNCQVDDYFYIGG